MEKDPACGGSLSTSEAAVVLAFSLRPKIDLKVLKMFFELVPKLNAVSFALLIEKKEKM